MGDDRELLRLHLAALFAWNGEGRMTVTNEPLGRPAPRLFLGRTDAGNVWCFGHDVPPDVSDALERLCAWEPDSLDSEEWDPAPFVAVLANTNRQNRCGTVTRTGSHPTCRRALAWSP